MWQKVQEPAVEKSSPACAGSGSPSRPSTTVDSSVGIGAVAVGGGVYVGSGLFVGGNVGVVSGVGAAQADRMNPMANMSVIPRRMASSVLDDKFTVLIDDFSIHNDL
jgi:hypothetical protein